MLSGRLHGGGSFAAFYLPPVYVLMLGLVIRSSSCVPRAPARLLLLAPLDLRPYSGGHRQHCPPGRHPEAPAETTALAALRAWLELWDKYSGCLNHPMGIIWRRHLLWFPEFPVGWSCTTPGGDLEMYRLWAAFSLSSLPAPQCK